MSVWNAQLADSIVVLLANGDGTFHQLAPFNSSAAGQAIALADLNGDGKLDLIVGDCCGETESVYLLGKGDGTFQTPSAINRRFPKRGTNSWMSASRNSPTAGPKRSVQRFSIAGTSSR